MERDYPTEMIRAFGPCLTRLYNIDHADLPSEIKEVLERLRHAEGTSRSFASSEPEAH